MDHTTQAAFCDELEKICASVTDRAEAYGREIGGGSAKGAVRGAGVGAGLGGLGGAVAGFKGTKGGLKQKALGALGAGALGGLAGGSVGGSAGGALGGVAALPKGIGAAIKPPSPETVKTSAETEYYEEPSGEDAGRSLGGTLGTLGGIRGGLSLAERMGSAADVVSSRRVAKALGSMGRLTTPSETRQITQMARVSPVVKGGLMAATGIGTALGARALGRSIGGRIGRRFDQPGEEKEASAVPWKARALIGGASGGLIGGGSGAMGPTIDPTMKERLRGGLGGALGGAAGGALGGLAGRGPATFGLGLGIGGGVGGVAGQILAQSPETKKKMEAEVKAQDMLREEHEGRLPIYHKDPAMRERFLELREQALAGQDKEAGVALLSGLGRAAGSLGRLGKAAIKGKVKAPKSLAEAGQFAKSTGRHLKTQFQRGTKTITPKQTALGAGIAAGTGGFAVGRMSKREQPR